MHETKESIRFCAIVQKDDHIIVAVYNHSKMEGDVFIKSCKQIVGSSRISSLSSAVIENAVECCSCLTVSDEHNIYALYVDSTYPQRIGFQLLEKIRLTFIQESKTFADTEFALSKKVKPWMKKLCAEFNDVTAKDKVFACQEKVDEVRNIMNDNIQKIMQNSEHLEDLELRSAHLKDNAAVFVKNSKALSNKLWWQNARLRVAIAAVGTTVGLGIGATVLPI
jgi:hypothetical protein